MTKIGNNNIIKVREIMKKLELDALIVTDRFNMNYISGYMGDTGMLFFCKDKQYVMTDSRYTEIAARQAVGFECIDIGGRGYANTMKEKLETLAKADMINDENLTVSYDDINNQDKKALININLGFEDNDVSYKQYVIFSNIGAKLVPVEDEISSLRQIKNDEEIEKIARAEAIGDEAFSHILEFIKVGMTEREIALELEVAMRKAGASGLSFDTIAASGENSSMPHAVPTDRTVRSGDFITMDFGCLYEGYCSDMTRTIYVSGEDVSDKISDKKLEVYNTVLKAQTESMKMIRSGVKCSEVDACARNIIAQAGYGDYFGHGLGHSVGLFIHEEPRFSPKCDDILKSGMVITVEPGIYLPGEFGVRIEDLVVVTEDGYRNLTSSPKQLICINQD